MAVDEAGGGVGEAGMAVGEAGGAVGEGEGLVGEVERSEGELCPPHVASSEKKQSTPIINFKLPSVATLSIVTSDDSDGRPEYAALLQQT